MAIVAMLPVVNESYLDLHGSIIYFTMYMYLCQIDVLSGLSIGVWFLRIWFFGTLWIWYFYLLRTNSHKVPKCQSKSASSSKDFLFIKGVDCLVPSGSGILIENKFTQGAKQSHPNLRYSCGFFRNHFVWFQMDLIFLLVPFKIWCQSFLSHYFSSV